MQHYTDVDKLILRHFCAFPVFWGLITNLKTLRHNTNLGQSVEQVTKNSSYYNAV